jgi:hypothetical protein
MTWARENMNIKTVGLEAITIVQKQPFACGYVCKTIVNTFCM